MLRRALLWVIALNLGYCGVEVTVATVIGSVSLFADSIDFLEDASLNLLVLLGLGWAARRRARLGMGLSFVLLVPVVATLWTAWTKLALPVPPAPLPLSLTGVGAFATNLCCAIILLRHRHGGGSLTRAAFLSARNDVIANIAIVIAGLLTAYAMSIWPDLVVGLAIAAMNAGSAREVWLMARGEAASAPPRA